MLPLELLEYVDASGRSPFTGWFDSLNAPAAAKVVVALTRLRQANLSNVRAVGSGVTELKIDFGPGYRVYFGKDGDLIVVLLGGGTKKRQQNDIASAVARWNDYKKRRRLGEPDALNP